MQAAAVLLLAAAAAGMDTAQELERLAALVREREEKQQQQVAASLTSVQQQLADHKRQIEELRSSRSAPASAGASPPAAAGAAAGTAPPSSRKPTAEEMGWVRPPPVDTSGTGHAGPPPDFNLARGGADAGEQARAALGKLEGAQPGTPPAEADLDRFEQAIKDAQQRMCDTWPDHSDCMLLKGDGKTAPFAPVTENDPLELNLAWKLVLRDEPFLFRVLGSSTSAGHGAFFNSTYAVTTMRWLRPVFAKIGVEWETRNQAMGGWDYRAGTIWCLPQIAGRNVDLVTWEWSMFSSEACTVETYVRAFMALPHRPSVIAVYINGPGMHRFWGEFYFAVCKPADAPAWGKELCDRILASAARIESGKAGDGEKGRIPCGGDVEWERVIKDGACLEKYSAERGFGRQSDPVWREAADKFFDHFKRPRPNPNVYPPWTPDENFRLMMNTYPPAGLGVYAADFKGDNGRDWQPWWLYRMMLLRSSHHAGTFGHVLSGQMISYWILERTLAAIARIRKSLREFGSMDALATEYRRQRTAYRLKPLPDPVACNKPGLEAERGGRHKCYTSFLPREEESAALAPRVTDAGGWSVATLGLHQKDDGQMYRDHKLVSESKGSSGAMHIKATAPLGSPTKKVDVAVCLYWWQAEHAGEASCGGQRVRLWRGNGKCGKDSLQGKTDPPAPYLTLRSTGAKLDLGKNRYHTPLAGGPGLDQGTNEQRMPCVRVCQVPAGTEVDIELKAEPGCQLSISHVVLVDSDSSSPPPGP
eukprot:TRINITY_DN2595_c1_g1_i1.p1 TRINITY_DN2595_c1_g1~~TRINITY_DN2595_c1_g1_i1.p1  ORF type:complete len:786 (+),score=223.81 TRINITY_DN2595_c1_g1_i1:80-2359(+)